MMNWLRKRLWLIAVIGWVVFSDRVEPFRSHFWLASLGAVVVGLLTVAIEVGFGMLARRSQDSSL